MLQLELGQKVRFELNCHEIMSELELLASELGAVECLFLVQGGGLEVDDESEVGVGWEVFASGRG